MNAEDRDELILQDRGKRSREGDRGRDHLVAGLQAGPVAILE